MDIRQALAHGRSQLSQSSSATLDARLLLQHLLGRSHASLVAHDDDRLTADQVAGYLALIERAGRGEPIPYLTGQAAFYGRDFHVTPAVLIPRPETEQLVEAALDWAGQKSGPLHAADVGAGSGCIAVTLAAERPDARVTAVDLSADALRVARRNARRHSVAGRVAFVQGNLLQAAAGPFDLIVANLPYVADGEWTMLDDAVKLYEPSLALWGGADGLELIRRLLVQAQSRLRSGGAIFLEIGWQQGSVARRVAQSTWPTAVVELRPDYAGRDRIVIIRET